LATREQDLQAYEQAFKQLLLILASDQESNEEILVVPDPNLAKNQLEAVLTRNKNMAKVTHSIVELELEISYLKKEKENKSKNLYEKD
jgi:hypothetical protein